MRQFKAFDQNVEVRGNSVIMVIEAMQGFERMATNIFAQFGFTNVIKDEWYPQQPYLDAYQEIYEKIGPTTMKLVGKRTPENVLWPSNIRSITEALASIDVAYHMNHRGGEIGYYRFEQTGGKSGKMVCSNPYPCPYDHGLIEAIANKFAPLGGKVRVIHDESQPCRLTEGTTCTYQISW